MKRTEQLDELGISAFAESMAMMIQSGVTTEEALLLLRQDNHEGILASALEDMAKDSEEGKSLFEAMSNTGIFPKYALEMVKAGESTGGLENVMRHLADYYQNQKEVNDKLRSSILYPASMIAMIIVVLIIVLVMVLPAFQNVYTNLSAASAGYIRFAYALCITLLVIMVLIVALALIGLYLYRNGKKSTVEKWLRKIPLVANILDDMGTFRFTSAFEMYLSSGEMQDNALAESMELTDCPEVEEKLKKCAAHMEEGHGFAYAANKEELYEAIYGRMLVPAERSGNMSEILERLIGLLKADISNSVTRLINTVEPLLSGILMISIGLILISLMLPLIGMMNSIG